MKNKIQKKIEGELPATTEIFMSLYLSTKMSIVCLKALGSNNNVVISWNIIPNNFNHKIY